MPKVQIEIDQDTYNKLKIEAKSHFQSLRGFIADQITQHVNNPLIKTKPEGVLTLTKEQQRSTFFKLCEEIMGKTYTQSHRAKIEREYLTITPDLTYYDDCKEDEGRYTRLIYTAPIERQRDYIIEMEHYLKDED